MLVRHLLSIALLPVVVVVLVPRWLLLGDAGSVALASAPLLSATRIAGALLFAAGFALFAWCVTLFARVGRGTLAPWDPTRRLVVVGPYAHVRNPMISGVFAVIVGEAVALGTSSLWTWAGLFLAINHIYFVLSEERGLARRFGAE